MKTDTAEEELLKKLKVCAKDDHSTPEFWNAHAHPFGTYERRTSYYDDFLARARIKPGETVFDMGCGSGTICIPLADEGHHVFCADFSEGMLQSVADVVSEEGIETLTLQQLNWNEDWDAYDLPVCDVAIASRSFLAADILDAVKKLDSVARRRVCITTNADRSMFHQTVLEKYIGRPAVLEEGYRKVIEAVLALGYKVQVDYINTERLDVFEDREDLVSRLQRKVEPFAPGEKELFDRYCEEHILPFAEGGVEGFVCDNDTVSSWAFIAWDKFYDTSTMRREVITRKRGQAVRH